MKHLNSLLALVAGLLVLIFRSQSVYFIGIYLILIGLVGLFGSEDGK